MSKLDQHYWNQRYLAQDTPWDTGAPTPPLQQIIDQIEDRQMRILIPGAGNGHEAVYLHQKGFSQVIVCDWAEAAITQFAKQAPDFPKEHLLIADFFALEDSYDFILEQTFFCALSPTLREAYVKKTAALLHNRKGRLTGLFFSSHFPFTGPPFGGTKAEYQKLFKQHFDIEQLEACPNSIPPRLGNELIFRFKAK